MYNWYTIQLAQVRFVRNDAYITTICIYTYIYVCVCVFVCVCVCVCIGARRAKWWRTHRWWSVWFARCGIPGSPVQKYKYWRSCWYKSTNIVCLGCGMPGSLVQTDKYWRSCWYKSTNTDAAAGAKVQILTLTRLGRLINIIRILSMLSFFLDQVCSVCWRMLTYADVCRRMLTYADVCWRHHPHSLCILSFFLHQVEFLKKLGGGEADDEHKQVGVCWRADVRWRMLTYAD
jgi:hypothetical protein